jgi:glycosyltransferase involved in cell wall biosynthesis
MEKMEKELKFISIVAYVRNCEGQISPFLQNVMGKCSALFDRCELVLVNDASGDGSVDEIHHYLEEHPADYMVSIIRMSEFQGLEASMNAGRDIAIGDYVYEFDDLYIDYDMKVIEDVYRKCLEGNDIVSAAGDARLRLTSRLFYRIYNNAGTGGYHLRQSTFRLLSRRAINRVKSMGAYIPYRKAVYMNCGLKAAGIIYRSQGGKGSMTRHYHRDKRISTAMDSFIYFTDVMEHISFWISMIFLVAVIAVVVYVIVSIFFDARLESGWTSLMGFMSIGFFGVFTLLTIILKYLSVLVDLVFRKQHYLIEDVEKISGN